MKCTAHRCFLAASLLALVACNPASPPPAASTEPAPVAPAAMAPAAPAAPTVGPLTSLTSSLESKKLARLDASELEKIQEQVHCSLDSINEKPLDVAAVTTTGETRFSGFMQSASLAQPTFIVLKGTDTYIFRNSLTAERADIAQAKGISADSAYDYSAYAELAGVSPGTYEVVLLGEFPDAVKKCQTSETIIVN